MNKEKRLVEKYFKIKNPNGKGIFKVVNLEEAVNIANSACETCKYLNEENNFCPIIDTFVDVYFGCINHFLRQE